MFFVLCLQIAAVIVCQIRLRYVYTMEEVTSGLKDPPVTFLEEVPLGLRGFITADVLIIIGLWGVKFNFLLFFYRIFCSTSGLYRKLWWVVVAITIACLATFFGVKPYECTVSDVEVIFTTCSTPEAVRTAWISIQTTSAIDAFNDLLSKKHSYSFLTRVVQVVNLLGFELITPTIQSLSFQSRSSGECGSA